jgi:hypothetical protein
MIPSIQHRVSHYLTGIASDLRTWSAEETEVRLYLYFSPDGKIVDYRLADGDPSYDTDHTGYCAAGTVRADFDDAACLELAGELLEEATEASHV